MGDKGNAPTIYTGPVYIVDNTYILWATQWTMSPTIYTYAPTIYMYAPTILTHNIYRCIYCGEVLWVNTYILCISYGGKPIVEDKVYIVEDNV